LIPYIEANVNLFELGPKNTGKSFLPRNISYYNRLISGGKISPATMFFHGIFRTIGEIGIRDCVLLDEVSRIEFNDPAEMMGKLKDYMENCEFERGQLKRARSTCSLMFMGNIEVQGKLPATEFSDVLPSSMLDAAFIDRINGLIPGWEFPKIGKRDVHISKGYGLGLIYFCEILHQFRKENYQLQIEKNNELFSNIDSPNIRDEKSVNKIASGMLKLLCPHENYSKIALKKCLDIAVEYRNNTIKWLHELAPGEDPLKKLSYKILDNTKLS